MAFISVDAIRSRTKDIVGTVTIPVAAYRFRNFHAQYDIGAQRRASGSVAYDQGGFYGGTKTTLAYSLGRVVLSPKLAVEPSLSFNWVGIPQGKFVAKVITAGTIYTFTLKMFADHHPIVCHTPAAALIVNSLLPNPPESRQVTACRMKSTDFWENSLPTSLDQLAIGSVCAQTAFISSTTSRHFPCFTSLDALVLDSRK